MQAASPSDVAFDPAAHGWTHEPEDGFLGLVGPIWMRRDATGTRFGFVADRQHANLLGVVQGGMMMTFADRGLGMLAWEAADGRPSVTLSFDMQFMGPGRIGTFIELSGEAVRRTASFVFMRGLVTSGSDALAVCQGSWKVRFDPPARAV